VASLAVWAVAEIARRPREAWSWLSWQNARSAAPWVAGFLLLGVVVLVPIFGDLQTFFNSLGLSPAGSGTIASSNLGNLSHPLSGYESLGIWWSADFRQNPLNAFHAGELSALALAVMLFGLGWALRRRQLILPAAVVAAELIWLYSNHSQSPYVAAKALVIGSPVVMAVALRPLLTPHHWPRPARVLGLAVAAVFCVAAGYSTYRSLQSQPVQAPEAEQELAAFHRVIGDSRVLFLGIDDWAPWELHDSPVTTLSVPTPSVGGAVSPPNKPFASAAMDFDSVVPHDLNTFPYVITTNTSYASQPPANFHLVASRRLYQLWRRVGPTPQFESIEPPGAPGAVLNCRVPALKQLVAHGGEAAVMAQPETFPGTFLAPGHSTDLSLALPQGQWELSIEYTSTVQMAFAAQGRKYTMPAYLGRPGADFNVGAVTGQGVHSPIVLHVNAQRPSFLTGSVAYADVYAIQAVRLPDVRTIMPLRRACGRFVDWLRVR